MTERLFLVAVMILSAGYFGVAYFLIEARIQYDPLGPESWPMILGAVAFCAATARLFLPVGARFDLPRAAGTRIAGVLALLVFYAATFEHLGFVLSTWVFCTATTWALGTRPVPALVFGVAIGLGVYGLFTHLLDLTLPAGPLSFLE